MALIKCRECGKEYSNLAEKCPNCGVATALNDEQSKQITCLECNHLYLENEAACPNCSCPTTHNLKSKDKAHKHAINLSRILNNVLQTLVPRLKGQFTTVIRKHSIEILSVLTLILFITWGLTSFNSQEQPSNIEVEVIDESVDTPIPNDVSGLVFPVASKPAQRVGVLNTETKNSNRKFSYTQATTDVSDLRMTALTTNSVSIQLDSPLKVILMNSSGNLVKESTSQSKNVIFDGLKADTDYVLMSLNTKNEYLDYVVFETMNPSEDIDLQYIINFNDSSSEEVSVDIFGYFNGVSSYTLNNERYHTNLDELDIEQDSMRIKTNGLYDLKWNPETKISFSFKDKQGYFQVSYTSKKSANSSNNGGRIEGRKTSDYLIATGEQLLILPVRNNNSYSEDVSVSMNAPLNWGYNIGFTEPIDGFYKVEKDKEWTPLAPIQAYNLSNYKETILTYPDLVFEFIYPMNADNTEVNQLYDAWDMLYQLWGRSPDKGLRYTLFVADDNTPVYGGEYTTGQSYTTSYELLNEMGIHQFYHVWQGWKYHLQVDESYGQWWGEGFNRYFSHKVLEAVGDTSEGYQQLGVYYGEYNNSVEQGYLVSLLSTAYPYNAYEYNAGALYVYYMDKQLQTETKGAYSMDIVLKYALQAWIEKGTPFTYSGMINYIKDVSGVDFTQFFDEYVVKAEKPIVLDEFATNSSPDNSSDNSSFDKGIYGTQAPVELFASKFNNIFSGKVELASFDAFSEAKFNNFSNAVILHSLDQGKFPDSFNQLLGISSDPEMNKLNIYQNAKGGTIYVILTETEDDLLKVINGLSALD